MKFENYILTITTIFSGLMSGLFFSYSVSVVPGLGKLSDKEYIQSMQSINREIQNPVFFIFFLGILLLLPLSIYLSYSHTLNSKFWLLAIAGIVYYTGVFGVTALGNIPLNNTLENFNSMNAVADAIKDQRGIFEKKWNYLNGIRAISSFVTFVLMVMSCLLTEKT